MEAALSRGQEGINKKGGVIKRTNIALVSLESHKGVMHYAAMILELRSPPRDPKEKQRDDSGLEGAIEAGMSSLDQGRTCLGEKVTPTREPTRDVPMKELDQQERSRRFH
ncbi:hypothetical protein ACFE04_010573 [Oxalis oulophora]